MIQYSRGDIVGQCIFLQDIDSRKTKGGTLIRRGIFRCKCGKEFICSIKSLKSSRTKSCGCANIEAIVKRNKAGTTHGKTNTTEFSIWSGMKIRCYNPNVPEFVNYGGRGIVVCDRWLGKNGFINFLEDMGVRPSNYHTLEREDNNSNYSLENCKWATYKDQNRNRRNNKTITYNGISMCQSAWAESLGIADSTLKNRLKYMPLEKAFTQGKIGKTGKRTKYYV